MTLSERIEQLEHDISRLKSQLAAAEREYAAALEELGERRNAAFKAKE